MIDDIRAQISVPDALELLELEGPASGVPGHIPCFMHDENTASLYVEDDHWHAFCCGVGGDVVDLVMAVTGSDLGTALRYLSGATDLLSTAKAPERKPRELPDMTERFEGEAPGTNGAWVLASGYVAKKWPHLFMDDLAEYGVKVAGGDLMPRLMIPHRDATGIVRGIKLRLLDQDSYGKKTSLTGSCFTTRLYRVIDRPWARFAVLVEGESDTWSASKAYRGNLNVAVYGLPSGASCWKPAFAAELSRHGMVLVGVDPDTAGEKAWARIRDSLPCVVRLPIPGEFKDISEAIADGWKPVLA